MTYTMNIVSITIATVILSSFIVQKADFLPINDSCQTSQLLSFKPCPRWLNPRHTEHDYPIELQCYVSPDNTTVTWWKNGNQIMEDKHIHISPRGQTLTIVDPLKTDTGQYSCVARLNDSHISFSGYIEVREESFITRPRIVHTDPVDLEQEVRLGTSTNISCTIDYGTSSESDSPFNQPVMLWKRNGTEIDDNGEKFVYQHHSVGQEQVLILEIHNISREDLGDYQCYTKNGIGEAFQNITLKEVIPGNHGNNGIPSWLIIATSCGAAMVVLLILVGIFVIRRKSMDKNVEWEDPDMEHFEVPQHRIEYDVFISYSSEDEVWVRETLFQNLQTNGYNVNIDFKDFVPGMAIAENVMDSIYKSRKTVVVMSKNFLKSMWGQFELQQAHNRAISQRKDVLILIRYGKCKVPGKLMGKTFLDYVDKAIKPHFWQRLYDSVGKPGVDLQPPEVKDQDQRNEIENMKNTNKEQKTDNTKDKNEDQFEGYEHLIINLKNEKKKGEADLEVNIREKLCDHAKRLVSTESCDSQDSCIGRRISVEEKKPLLL